jgi:hypothetical protein
MQVGQTVTVTLLKNGLLTGNAITYTSGNFAGTPIVLNFGTPVSYIAGTDKLDLRVQNTGLASGDTRALSATLSGTAGVSVGPTGATGPSGGPIGPTGALGPTGPGLAAFKFSGRVAGGITQFLADRGNTDTVLQSGLIVEYPVSNNMQVTSISVMLNGNPVITAGTMTIQLLHNEVPVGGPTDVVLNNLVTPYNPITHIFSPIAYAIGDRIGIQCVGSVGMSPNVISVSVMVS